MTKLEETLAQGVQDGKIPHAVVYATNKDGSFSYDHATGQMNNPGPDLIQDDALFLLASSTKLLTSIAALQVVEKDLIGLDDDVAKVLPELAAYPIITGFDEDDRPILVERKKAITLRHLLTHSAGTTYDALDPDVVKYQTQRGHTPNTGDTVLERFGHPSKFEPGTAFMYGPNIDWAGLLIERLTNSTLEEYMKINMWQPLGITGITFWPDKSSELKDKVPGLRARGPDGKFVAFDGPFLNTGSKDCFGGHGLYAQMGEYIKVQQSILANDGKLLKPESVDMMFTPQLSAESAKSLQEFLRAALAGFIPGEIDPESKVDWGLGGMLFMEDGNGKRKKGTLCWGGATNPYWIIDREADIALTFGTQVLPPGDKMTGEMIDASELAVYEMAGVKF